WPADGDSVGIFRMPEGKDCCPPAGCVDLEALPSRERVLHGTASLKILFAGTFREKKGIEYLIRGAAKARKRGVRLHLTLVGDAAEKPGDFETKESVFEEINKLGSDRLCDPSLVCTF